MRPGSCNSLAVTCTEESKHDITQYVDDSSNIIGARSQKSLVDYTEDYLLLLAKYYRANKLKLNSEKTTYMMIGSQYKCRRRNKIILRIENENIEDDYSIKILGWWISPDGKMDLHLNKIWGAVCKALAGLRPFLRVLNLNQRPQLVYQKALSIAEYGLPPTAASVKQSKTG